MTDKNDECVPCAQKRAQVQEAVDNRQYGNAAKHVAEGLAMMVGKIIRFGGVKYLVDDQGKLEKVDEKF